jgi:hypothetical protein
MRNRVRVIVILFFRTRSAIRPPLLDLSVAAAQPQVGAAAHLPFWTWFIENPSQARL